MKSWVSISRQISLHALQCSAQTMECSKLGIHLQQIPSLDLYIYNMTSTNSATKYNRSRIYSHDELLTVTGQNRETAIQ